MDGLRRGDEQVGGVDQEGGHREEREERRTVEYLERLRGDCDAGL